jgi:sterol 24-C-methyltransferase
MAPPTADYSLEKEDKQRDAAFSKVLHGNINQRGGLASMFGKDSASKKEALDEYFKHWDNKAAGVETEETRKARRDEYATLTRQYDPNF